jgi:hypothetical protein
MDEQDWDKFDRPIPAPRRFWSRSKIVRGIDSWSLSDCEAHVRIYLNT